MNAMIIEVLYSFVQCFARLKRFVVAIKKKKNYVTAQTKRLFSTISIKTDIAKYKL